MTEPILNLTADQVAASPIVVGPAEAFPAAPAAVRPGPTPAVGGGGPPRQKFAVPDELTCYYDRPAEPANVHIEVRVRGRIDRLALAASLRAVLSAEPGLRARRVAASGWRHRYYWEYPRITDRDPLLIASWSDAAELAELRSAFLSESPSLDCSPPLMFLLASGPDADCLILNAHHACFDGLSCVRLLRRVTDAYGAQVGHAEGAGASPGDGGGGPAETEGGPAETEGSQAAARQAGGHEAVSWHVRAGRIARIAGQPGEDQGAHGYGAQLLAWDGLAGVGWLKAAGWSINDLLIAAFMSTIAKWNHAHGTRAGLLRITMPVGERTQAGAQGSWANLSRLAGVTAHVGPGTAMPELLSAVASQTRYAKEHPGPQVDLVSRCLAAAPVPVAAKRQFLRAALTIAGPLICDTSLVSNLGVIEPLRFGAADVTQAWFSTSAHMPRGLSLGAVTAGGRLMLTFRYRRALLSDPAAAAFARTYAAVLDGVAQGGEPR